MRCAEHQSVIVARHCTLLLLRRDRGFNSVLQAQEGSNGREGQQSAQLRPLAISLICGMAHSTQRTRAELWAHNGLELLLGLLQEQVQLIESLSLSYTPICCGTWLCGVWGGRITPRQEHIAVVFPSSRSMSISQ